MNQLMIKQVANVFCLPDKGTFIQFYPASLNFVMLSNIDNDEIFIIIISILRILLLI